MLPRNKSKSRCQTQPSELSQLRQPRYLNGPIVLQRTVPVLDDDTPDTRAARVFEQECEAYPEAICLFAEGRLRVERRRVRSVVYL